MRLRVSAVLAVICMPLMALAQPLADRVPADALIYLGGQGTAAMPPGYNGSHLKAIVDSSNLPELLKSYLPALVARVGQQNPQAAEKLKVLLSLVTPMIEHPCAFYFTGVDFEGPRPQPKLALICSAGSDAEALLKQIDGLLAQAPNPPVAVKAFRKGDLVAVTVGYADEASALAGDGGSAKPLAGDEKFKSALAQVQKDPVAAAYVNVEGVLALVDQALARANNPQAQEMWPKVRDALGLNGLKQIAATAAFDGADWGSQLFVAAPAPRGGLLALLDNAPVSDEMLRTIPKNSTFMADGHVDIAKFLSELRTAAGKIDPQNGQALFDKGMGAAQMALGGVNLQNDLFGSLGPEWACYIDDSLGGSGPLGCVLVNHLAKPEDALRAINRFQLFIDNGVNMLLVGRNLRLTFDQMKIGDVDVHYCMTPLVAPSWTIKDGNLYSALYPQVLVPAVNHVSNKAPSILDNPQFTAFRQRLAGSNKITSISYLDLPRTAEASYQTLLALAQLAMGASDMAGVKSPVLLIPPLSKLRENLAPAGDVGWSDDAGYHMKRISPFPGAELLGMWP